MKRLKKALALILSLTMTLTALPNIVSADETSDVLAFPGVSGGGKYSKGARGSETIEVYHVTNLNDKGTGSLRDALSKEGRIVVFDLDGAINLKSTLYIPSNTTILAQTAPGEGITVTGYDVQAADGAKDVIVRYLKVRPTDKNGGEPDGLGGKFGTRIVFDHCSTSWCVDELLTLYAGSYESTSETKPHGSYYTVQNTIASESLRMSSHFKGAHGYGAIWGADMASYHHNLLAHHDSRSPRLDREMNKTEVTNNIIYDWGQTNSAYGGEPYSMHDKSRNPTKVNYMNNYYNYGASTKSGIKNRIFDFTNTHSDEIKGDYYVSGNYVYGDSAVTSSNEKGLKNPGYANLLTEPIDMGEYQVSSETAEAAYSSVLENVGATLPKRDAIDARIINDVKNLTGRVINNTDEVGGGIDLNAKTTETRTFAVPESFKTENNLTSYQENEIITDGTYKGYTLIESYVNDWTNKQSAPTNAMITVISPTTAGITNEVNGYTVDRGTWKVVSEGETVNYHAVASPVGNTKITKFELYDKNTLIKDYGEVSEINDNITLPAGTHYLTSRAYNSKGEKTQSTEAIVYVKKTGGDIGNFSFTEIGTGKFKGQGGVAVDENGVYTLYGSGTTGSMNSSTHLSSNSQDSCSYFYKELSGNFDIRVKVNEIPKFENQQINGLMFRETLDPTSRMALISDGWLKYGENERIITRTTKGEKSAESYFKNKNGTTVENSSSGDNYAIAPYMRIVRYNDTVYLYVSQDGENWTNDTRQPESITFENLPENVYVGYATDSADTISTIPYFSTSSFSEISILKGDDVKNPADEDDGSYKPTYVNHDTSNGFSYGESFLMKDSESGGKWIISSDGSYEKCFEDVENIYGNETPKISLVDKAVQIEIPEKYQTGKYQVDFDFLTTNEAAAGRSFRVYFDNAVHPYNESTGQATEFGADGAFLHITDLANKVYNTTAVADISAKAANDTMNLLYDLTPNAWYHYTITGTNGENDLTLTVSKHGTDGKYNPSELSEPVYSGSISCTEGRSTIFKQLKFMKTAAGNLYFDNITFANLDSQEPSTEGTSESSTEGTTATETETETTAPERTGDVDGNGSLTAFDAAVVLQYVLNPTEAMAKKYNLEEGKVCDGKELTINDAVEILRKVLTTATDYKK